MRRAVKRRFRGAARSPLLIAYLSGQGGKPIRNSAKAFVKTFKRYDPHAKTLPTAVTAKAGPRTDQDRRPGRSENSPAHAAPAVFRRVMQA